MRVPSFVPTSYGDVERHVADLMGPEANSGIAESTVEEIRSYDDCPGLGENWGPFLAALDLWSEFRAAGEQAP